MSDARVSDTERWVDEHGDFLYRFALLRLRAPDLAADLVQETFLEALRSRERFAGRSSEATWLIGILKHKIADHFRRAARQTAAGAGSAEGEPVDSDFDRRGHWRVAPGQWGPDPEGELESKEFWEVFGRCLSKLPKALADAFLLRELDGLSSNEVQDQLGITPANLWARLHRSRMHLRDCLESSWFGGKKSSRHRTRFAKGIPPA
jgi:RNA polymerase sigma-70 factor (ECF subfamily)